ncbi:MAG: GNAT family N-acetyltransferase [Spirochaetaceae bacterium]|nr:MAG: GNAT family N-acetyltransferase [Spirochaetaceae bacterium]
MGEMTYVEDVRPEYGEDVRRITGSTDFFTQEEVAIAVELVEERLSRGTVSGYYFVFAFIEGRMVGYTSYGHIAGTQSSFDLYWIAVDNHVRGKNIGTELIKKTEEAIRKHGGTRIYVETSSKPMYVPTRAFYEKRGYVVEAILKDFYRKDDGKVIFVKVV